MKMSFWGLGLVIGICMVGLLSQPSRAHELVLDSLIAQALRANPDLKAAESRYKAFEAQVPQAGSLPNPMFQATISNVSAKSWTLGKTLMSGHEYMLSQTIPFPGKLGFAQKASRGMAQQSEQEYQSTKSFVLSELKQNYYQLYQLQKSIWITQENKQLLEDFAKIAATRYSVGEGLQQDVLKAQVEVSKMIDELISMEEMRRTTQAKINVLLARDPQDSLGETEELTLQSLSLSEEELQNLAIQNNPGLKGMEFEINAAESEYKMARREYWPDFALSLSYLRMRNDASMEPGAERNFVSASAGIEIPLYFWSKQKKKVEEKGFDLRSSRQKYEGMKNDLKFSVSELFYSLNKYRQQVELYQTAILPQARQSLESARVAYQVDKVDFMTLLDNQMTLYNYQIAFHQALTAYFQSVAQLEEIVGKPLL
ncbi:MAG: TolC family protein [Candidatus Zixiibacteriota bacterium]